MICPCDLFFNAWERKAASNERCAQVGVTQRVFLYILLEFQSLVDRTMHIRLLRYAACCYSKKLLKQKFITPGQDLPPVFPVVLYNLRPKQSGATGATEPVHEYPPVSSGSSRQCLTRLLQANAQLLVPIRKDRHRYDRMGPGARFWLPRRTLPPSWGRPAPADRTHGGFPQSAI